jgi:predicted Zn-dependent protease with MMP-like domain
MDIKEFEKLVGEAIDELPDKFREKLDNVAVMVEDAPSSRQLFSLRLPPWATLFGLYEGTPQTKRGGGYTFTLPDKITIFKRPIELLYRNPQAIKQKVKQTVRHEIAHHFGLTEKQIREKEDHQ